MSDQLLNILSDGEIHSGEQLGNALQISRTAVWKQIQKMQERGVPIESVKGKGYRLEKGITLLTRETIIAGLDDDVAGLIAELVVEDSVDSTNKRAILDGRCGVIYLAEQQSQGRGRRGKTWHSPYGQNIYLSICWEFGSGAAGVEGLSLAVGVELVETLQRLTGVKLGLKWPNDIYHGSKKLGGILVELTGDAAGPCKVVVGAGLNIAMTGEYDEIDQPWTALDSIAETTSSRNQISAEIISALIKMLSKFEVRGFAHYQERWNNLDIYKKSEVSMLLGDQIIPGTAHGVDSKGALVVETINGKRVFNGGEVSLRMRA